MFLQLIIQENLLSTGFSMETKKICIVDKLMIDDHLLEL